MLGPSLLGAVAFVVLTRMDVAVFISALQRVAHSPTVLHLKRLNALVRWLQRNLKRLRYRRLPNLNGGAHLRMYSDAAFKREGDSGHSMRGSLYLLVPGQDENAFKHKHL